MEDLATLEPATSGLTRIDPRADQRWDAFISRHQDATIFHTSGWARVLADTYGFTPTYFADLEGSQPAGLCLVEVESWLTPKRGSSLPFTDECTLLPSASFPPAALIQVAMEFARERGWKSVELRGVGDAPPYSTSPSLEFYSHELDFRSGPATLFKNLDGSVRQAIRKAEKSGVEVSIFSSHQAVREYFRLHCLTRKKHGVPPQPIRFFESIYRHIISSGRGFAALAAINGQAIAGAVFFVFKNRAFYKFGASNPKYDRYRANNLVMWKAIQHFAETSVESLDFGRTSLHNEGLRRYKLNWGSDERRLSYVKWDRQREEWIQEQDRSTGWQNAFFRLCPPAASRFLGECLYPHIA